MTRTNIVNTLCGTRGTGKTKFIQGDQSLNVKGIIPTYQEHNPAMNILIADTFDNPVWNYVKPMKVEDLPKWKRGFYRVFDKDTAKMMYYIEKYVYNTVIFFEDATKIIGSKLKHDEKSFVIDSKQKNLDLWFIFHSLNVVPNDLIRVMDYCQLFKTNEALSSSLMNKYNNNELLVGAFNRIKQHESRYYTETVLIGC